MSLYTRINISTNSSTFGSCFMMESIKRTSSHTLYSDKSASWALLLALGRTLVNRLDVCEKKQNPIFCSRSTCQRKSRSEKMERMEIEEVDRGLKPPDIGDSLFIHLK